MRISIPHRSRCRAWRRNPSDPPHCGLVEAPHFDRPSSAPEWRLAAGVVRLIPLKAEHAGELRRIRSTPEVERWWDPVEEDFPLADEPESTRYTVTFGERVVGMVQYAEELEPKYRSASIDIFLDPAVHGQGVGATAVRLIAEHLIGKRGHHRLQIDPAADNVAAIRAYTSAGFTPVGTVRLAERDAYDHDRWHDALLMEYAVDPASAARGRES